MSQELNDVLNSPEAFKLGEALNALNNTARKKIMETLNDDTTDIAVESWVLIREDKRDACGCLMMDGYGKGFTLEQWRDLQAEIDANESYVILDILGEFYGDKTLEIVYAANAFDSFVTTNRDEWTTGISIEAVLSAEGRKMVKAVVQRYCSIMP